MVATRQRVDPETRLYHLVVLVSESNKAAYITYGHAGTRFPGFLRGYQKNAEQQQAAGRELSPLSAFLLVSNDVEIRALKKNIAHKDIEDFRAVYERRIRDKGYEIIPKQVAAVKRGITDPPIWNL